MSGMEKTNAAERPVSFVPDTPNEAGPKRDLFRCRFSARWKTEHALESMRLPFRIGHTYRLSFWAKAEEPVVLSLSFHVWKNGTKHFVRPFSCRPAKEWKEYAFEVDLPESLLAEYPSLKDGFARLVFRLPAGEKRVLIDRILLKEIK